MVKVLVVEDDETTSLVLKNFLKEEGFEVLVAFDGEEALRLFDSRAIDLLLLDVMLPKISGFQLLKQIREKSDVPIIMLTAMDDEYSQMVGFQQLADDYITKPFSPKIVIERVKSVLRRIKTIPLESTYHYGTLTFDTQSNIMCNGSERIKLTKKEYQLLRYFFERKGKLLTREQLFHAAWEGNFLVYDRVLDSHIKNIRKKLPMLNIETIIGVGYQLGEYQDED